MSLRAVQVAAITSTVVAAILALLGVLLPDARLITAGAIVITADLLYTILFLILRAEAREQEYYDREFTDNDTQTG